MLAAAGSRCILTAHVMGRVNEFNSQWFSVRCSRQLSPSIQANIAHMCAVQISTISTISTLIVRNWIAQYPTISARVRVIMSILLFCPSCVTLSSICHSPQSGPSVINVSRVWLQVDIYYIYLLYYLSTQ